MKDREASLIKIIEIYQEIIAEHTRFLDKINKMIEFNDGHYLIDAELEKFRLSNLSKFDKLDSLFKVLRNENSNNENNLQ